MGPLELLLISSNAQKTAILMNNFCNKEIPRLGFRDWRKRPGSRDSRNPYSHRLTPVTEYCRECQLTNSAWLGCR